MALGLKNNILNQKGTPAFYSDVFANRPAFGYAGRVFISTDTGAIYEDTGSAWTLIADAGAGTTGTLQQVTTNGNTTSAGIVITAGGLSANSISNSSFTTGSVLFADGSGTITQKNTNLFWDNTNNRLGIGNASPGTPLDVHGTGTAAQFNGTGTNNAFIQFQNAGTSKWRLGNLYNAAANDFQLYNNNLASNAIYVNGADNQVQLLGNIAAVGIDGSATSNRLQLRGSTATSYIEFLYSSSAFSNWNIKRNITTNNLVIERNNTSGTLIDTPMSINNSTGLITFTNVQSTTLSLGTYTTAPTNGLSVSGNTLIGTNTDNGAKLQINGAVFSLGTSSGLVWSNRGGAGSYTLYSPDGVNSYVYNGANILSINMSTGIYTPLSDINKKKDFEVSTIGLNAILNLKPTLFRMINEDETKEKTLGFIAQEVKPYIPQAYVENNNFIGLTDRPIIAVLVKAVQEIHDKLVKNNIN